MIIPGTTVTLEFLQAPQNGFAPIYINSGIQSSSRLGSVNAGNSGLGVQGSGGVNKAFDKALFAPSGPFPTSYSFASSQAPLLATAQKKGGKAVDAGLTGPVSFMSVLVGSMPNIKPGQGIVDGTVFIDVFSAGFNPFKNPSNAAMLYIVPPNPGNYLGGEDQKLLAANFLEAIRLTAVNIIDSVRDHNSNQAGGTVPVIDVLRMTAYSSAIFQMPGVSVLSVAQHIYDGLKHALQIDSAGLQIIELPPAFTGITT